MFTETPINYFVEIPNKFQKRVFLPIYSFTAGVYSVF
jgi:hypothetical protein